MQKKEKTDEKEERFKEQQNKINRQTCSSEQNKNNPIAGPQGLFLVQKKEAAVHYCP